MKNFNSDSRKKLKNKMKKILIFNDSNSFTEKPSMPKITSKQKLSGNTSKNNNTSLHNQATTLQTFKNLPGKTSQVEKNPKSIVLDNIEFSPIRKHKDNKNSKDMKDNLSKLNDYIIKKNEDEIYRKNFFSRKKILINLKHGETITHLNSYSKNTDEIINKTTSNFTSSLKNKKKHYDLNSFRDTNNPLLINNFPRVASYKRFKMDVPYESKNNSNFDFIKKDENLLFTQKIKTDLKNSKENFWNNLSSSHKKISDDLEDMEGKSKINQEISDIHELEKYYNNLALEVNKAIKIEKIETVPTMNEFDLYASRRLSLYQASQESERSSDVKMRLPTSLLVVDNKPKRFKHMGDVMKPKLKSMKKRRVSSLLEIKESQAASKNTSQNEIFSNSSEQYEKIQNLNINLSHTAFKSFYELNKKIQAIKNTHINKKAIEYKEEIATTLNKSQILIDYIDQLKEKKIEVKTNHRNIYVILDGQTVINSLKNIQGEFLEIPDWSEKKSFTTKKDRLALYYQFLDEAGKKLKIYSKLKSIFTMNGIVIFDLFDIPREDSYIFVSPNPHFRGLHKLSKENPLKEIYNPKKIIKRNTIISPEFIQWMKSKSQLSTKNNSASTFINKTFSIRKIKLSQDLKNNTKLKLKRLAKIPDDFRDKQSQSFTSKREDFDQFDHLDYHYYSDNEKRFKKHQNYLTKYFPTKLSLFVYFNDFKMQMSLHHIRTTRSKMYKCRTNEKNEKKKVKFEKERISSILDNYNSWRLRHNKYFQNNSEIKSNSNKNEIVINEDLIEIRKKVPKAPKENRNILNCRNIYFQMHNKIQKFYPDLVALNIPRLLKAYPQINRIELYEIFVQFKILMKICIALNKSMDLLEKGIDFDTFFNAFPQMKSQGSQLARKIFESINTKNNTHLCWEDFLNGMINFRSRDIQDKIDMFFSIIDSDGNGKLSYSEVRELSIMSLTRGTESEANNPVVLDIADYFASLIFELVGVPLDAQIPLKKIKDKIVLGGPEATYLEMFVCVDSNYDQKDNVNFN